MGSSPDFQPLNPLVELRHKHTLIVRIVNKKDLDNSDNPADYVPMKGMENQGETKRCPRCGEVQPLGAFYREKKRPDGLQTRCRRCHDVYREANKEAISAQRKAYRAANRGAIFAQQKAWHESLKKANLSYLASIRPLNCDACGYDKCFAALEFHHTDPGQKENGRDCMGIWLRFNFKKFKAKVDMHRFRILCANCHRELHDNEKLSKENLNDKTNPDPNTP